MKEILLQENGRTISRIHSAECITDVLPYLGDYSCIRIVYDQAVSVHVQKLLPHIQNCTSLSITADENTKSIDTVLGICRHLLDNNTGRSSLLLAIGGGITTDIAGLAASIYKRGIDFAHIPTTLLSQVDAAIGGKTGVNFEGLKNMLGVIRQPVFTFECAEVLETLPYGEFVGGSAEMLKSFIIENNSDNYGKAVELLSEIQRNSDHNRAIHNHKSALLGLIHAAAEVKAGVVGRDQFEKGERRKLNLGHSFAHAIEKRSDYAIPHGEAVAIGIVMAAEMSDSLGLSDGTLAERLRKDFKTCGLPTGCPYPRRELLEAMSNDKKAENGILHFVLMTGIGDVVIKDMILSDCQ